MRSWNWPWMSPHICEKDAKHGQHPKSYLPNCASSLLISIRALVVVPAATAAVSRKNSYCHVFFRGVGKDQNILPSPAHPPTPRSLPQSRALVPCSIAPALVLQVSVYMHAVVRSLCILTRVSSIASWPCDDHVKVTWSRALFPRCSLTCPSRS